MSKKLFSLIHNDSVHSSGALKVIPSSDYSTIASATEILVKVKQDAELYRKEVAAECEKLKEQAQLDGFDEGFKKWIEHVARLEQEIIKVRQDQEKMLVPVAISAAKKIVGKEIELSESVIVDIVSNNLKAVAQHKKITIYVNKKDLSILETNRTKLKQLFENLEVLSLRERADVLPGGCIIETEGGIINAQLANKWRVLEIAFETLLKKPEKT